MLSILSVLLVLTAAAFAAIVMAMALRESWGKIVVALDGVEALPVARRYRVRKVRNAGLRKGQSFGSVPLRAAA